MFGLLSIVTLAAIAFDRYNVIVNPLKVGHVMSGRSSLDCLTLKQVPYLDNLAI